MARVSKLKRAHRGDDGYTDLASSRVWKGSTIVELMGAIDEAVAAMGVAKCFLDDELRELVSYVQRELMAMCSRIAIKDFQGLDQVAKEVELKTQELWESRKLEFRFVTPGPPQAAAFLHLARAICRRAERAAWRAHAEGHVPREVAIVLNRVSDLLYAMSLAVEKASSRNK